MKIEIIEDRIEKIEEPNYASIIELIVDAVRAYPLYELSNTEEYFNEIKKILNANEITITNLKSYLDDISTSDDEQTVWVIDSLSSLVEAFGLMQLYKISFKEVISKIESLK